MAHLAEEGAILVTAIQVQADGSLSAVKLLGATVKSFVSSGARTRTGKAMRAPA
jgi:hypothetical protein